MKAKPLFLLDANLSITEEEKKSRLYVELKQIANPALPDYIVLKIAIEKQLTLITKDKGMLVRALIVGVNVIFQDGWGRRYYAYGSKTEYLGQVSQVYQKHLSRMEKAAKIISEVIPQKIGMSGFHQITCF